jgi:N-carbamoylputrescine amidase
MSTFFKACAIQSFCVPEQTAQFDRVAKQIEEAASLGAQLIVLPEIYLTPYFCQTEDPAHFALAETIPGPATKRLGELAARLNVVIVASLFERRAAGLYHNTTAVLDADGSLAGIYRKMHIPDDPGFYEKYYFAPGDLGYQPIKTQLGRLGVLICWDQWFPEAARAMALNGAELLIYPTAIGWDSRDDEAERARQTDAWLTVQRGHAIANALPLISCNRIGYEPDPSKQTTGIQFWGHSMIVGAQGEWLAKSEEEELYLMAEIDLSRTEKVRQIWPYLRDRRIDSYGVLHHLYGK